MMTTTGSCRAKFEAAGYIVREADEDAGIHRVFRPRPDARPLLVGLYVIRSGRATYAELNGTVFSFLGAPYDTEISRLYRFIRENPSA